MAITEFTQYQLRVRRLVDISRIDMSVSLFGDRAHSPILLCPCGALSAFHPRGEVEVARAVNTRGHIMTLSNAASQPIEDVVAARGGPVWFQLYRDPDWSRTLAMIKRAEAAGSPALAWTIDSQGGGKRIVHARARRRDRAFCGTCHTLNPDDRGLALPGFLGSTINPDGKPMTTTPPLGPPRLDGRIATWDYVKRLKDATSMKVVLKGIVTREDAELALEYGADGIWVSNHGGRMENSLRSSVECVPEVAAGVAGRAPIIVDGGFRRGTDIFKALALGATAVGVGRPYIFGLAAFGPEKVPDRRPSPGREVEMRCGTPAVVVVAALAVGCDAERPPESGPEPNWEGGESQVVTLSSRAPREGTAGVGADSGTGVSPSVYANSFTRGDSLTAEELEDPDLRVELSEETDLVVLILRRDEPGWFLRGGGDEVVDSGTFSQRPDGQWETVARFGP